MNASVDSLDWTLCVCTLDRADVLATCVRLSLCQTVPPSSVVIVDASDNWEDTRATISSIVGSTPLRYVQAHKRSLAVQRNQAIELATGSVLFLIDDDSLMYADCAEKVLSVYYADSDHLVSAVGITGVAALPNSDMSAHKRKKKGAISDHGQSWILRFLFREVLLMTADKHFVPYDAPRDAASLPDLPEAVTALATQVNYLSGYCMTVRREVARKEPFDSGLLAYCPGEDLDATYRFSRHGRLVIARDAHLHHFEAASGRLKRKQAITLALTNSAYFLRKNAECLTQAKRAYYVMILRRLIAEFLKDGLTLRMDFPQFRGAIAAIRLAPAIFRSSEPDFIEWYQDVQKTVLKKYRKT